MNMALQREGAILWRCRLLVAFRTGSACFMAGLVMQLGSMHARWVTFPVFAYVMAVTVVGESTFGKAFQDTLGVVAGTVQGVGLPMLVLHWLIPPRDISFGVAVACIAASSFLFTYGLGPARLRNTLYGDNILAKRVALAHSAIIFVNALSQKENMEELLFPLRLAGTTIVGATCGMIALLLPFPRLASFEIHKETKLFGLITSQQIQATVGAFCTDYPYVSSAMHFQSNSLRELGAKVCDEISSKERDMGWEARRLICGGFSPGAQSAVKAFLSSVRDDLMGMDLAITSAATATNCKLLSLTIPGKLKDKIVSLADWVCLALAASVGSQQSGKSELSMHANREGQSKIPKNYPNILIIDEGKEALTSFDQEMAQFLISTTTPGIAGESLSVHDAIYWSKEELAIHFFLFNMRHAAERTMDYLRPAAVGVDHPPRKSSSAVAHTSQLQLHVNSCTTGNREVHMPVDDDGNHDMPSARANHEVPRTAVAGPVSVRAKEFPKYSFLPAWGWSWKWSCIRRVSTSSQNVRKLLKPNSEQLQTALKMALAMAVGASLGFWFDEPKGYWADITLALGYMGPSKGGSFKVAVLRSFGTVAGSIYGLVTAMATQTLSMTARLTALVPWVILTSFLRQSKLFGYAGAVSAFTGAVVILARTSGPSSPSSISMPGYASADRDFTVVRIVEAFLGMASFVLVELLVFPRRAASLLKADAIAGLENLKALSLTILSAFATCAADAEPVPQCLLPSCTGFHQDDDHIRSSVRNLRATADAFAVALSRQRKLVKEATDEPQFWFTPFPSQLFFRLIAAQTRLLQYLRFTISASEDMFTKHAPIVNKNNIQHHLRGSLEKAMQITIQDKLVATLTFLTQVLSQPTIQETSICTTNDSCNSVVNVDIPIPAAISQESHLSHAFNQARTVLAETILSGPSQRFPSSPHYKLQQEILATDQCKSFRNKLHDQPSHHPLLLPTSQVLVSLVVLQFALQGILQTTEELQSIVQELLQEENPWRLINFHAYYHHVMPKK